MNNTHLQGYKYKYYKKNISVHLSMIPGPEFDYDSPQKLNK